MPPGFGGSPTLAIPTFPQQPFPVFPPQAQRQGAPAAWQAAPGARQPQQPNFPVNAALAGNTTRPPTVRAQAPDAPARSKQPLMLPTPEALGLAAAAIPAVQSAPAFDWNEARARLRRLGAVGFHLDEVAAGQWRATLLMPMGNQQSRHIEASAASDAAALASVLQQAEALAASR